MTQAVSTAVHRPQVLSQPPNVELLSLEPNNDVVAETQPGVQLCFSQRKIEELQRRKKSIGSRSKAPLNPTSHPIVASEEQQSNTVHCQCGFDKEDGDMVSNCSSTLPPYRLHSQIECSYCSTWQHVACYGYMNEEDKRIPEVHACYKCLLWEKEGPLLLEMQKLVVTRRAIDVISRRGYASDTDLARIIRELRELYVRTKLTWF